MKKRFHANQRILSGLAFRFAIAFLLCSPAIAQQLAPNPNPSGNTISILTSAENSVDFDNLGTINNDGNLNNYIYDGDYIYITGTIHNYSGGTINNNGTIDNNWGGIINNYVDGKINNMGTIRWEFGGIINNDGIINNYMAGTIHPYGLGTINNTGTINNDGTIYTPFDSFIHNTGTINNWLSGTIDIGSMSQIRNWGTINNEGTIDIHSEHMHNYSTINNTGTITGGEFFNPGITNNYANGKINYTTINNMYTINNEGTITNSLIWNQGTFVNNGSIDNTYLVNLDTFKGTGTFIGDLLNDIGTVAPGNSAGTMTVDGDFILAGSGILEIEIGGFTPGTFDLLDITGTADMLGGNINFSFLDGYDIVTDVGPYQSMDLTFLSAGYIDSFNSLINYNFMNLPYFQFDVFQRGNDLVFEATNLVPLPGAVLLGGIGLAVAGWKLRKRREL